MVCTVRDDSDAYVRNPYKYYYLGFNIVSTQECGGSCVETVQMARNEEKQYGRLNRLYLLREKEEFEKANPKRPRLETLYTAEEVQKWLPSIKKDLDFYLKKSQVTCYSDAHVEECREKVIKLEKEFKAFVRKIKQLSPSPLDVIPWTNRPYKRKTPITDSSKGNSCKEFKRIVVPILENDTSAPSENSSKCDANWNLMNQPLNFSSAPDKNGLPSKQGETLLDMNSSSMCDGKRRNCDQTLQCLPEKRNVCTEKGNEHKISEPKIYSIVNYDSSDSDNL